jgi:hypothetical protein
MDDLEKTKQYVATKDGVGFNLTSILDMARFNEDYKISGYPTTILIKADATVERVWMGELTDKQVAEISELMGV